MYRYNIIPYILDSSPQTKHVCTLYNALMRPHHWPPVIGGTRTLRNVRMLREFVRRSMPLLPPW